VQITSKFLPKKISVIFTITIIGILGFSITASAADSTIPTWIKNIAGFWANDQITDQEFLSAIQFLLDSDILQDSTLKLEEITDEEIKSDDTSTPIESTESKISTNLDLNAFKVVQLQELVKDPLIVQAVIDSNAKFAAMNDPHQYIVEKDLEWKNQPKNENSPFMDSLAENNISEILKSKSILSTEEFGDVLFPEIFITNEYGANIAMTVRTEDYNQADEPWWTSAENRYVQFRETSWDESAGIFSADIIIRIHDIDGNFVGVLNAATPVR
jgi:hypothetical protein